MLEPDARSQGGSRRGERDSTFRPPIVSIVVVVFEDCAELRELVTNIGAFRSEDVELVIVDGGSADGTLDLLHQHNDTIDYWVSERDRGIYDAMNKGVAVALGNYILHINAGDRLLELPLAQLSDMGQRGIDVVCCRVLEDDKSIFQPRLGWRMRIDNRWHHQGTFYRREGHLGYDISYRVFGDFDHNQRLSKMGARVALLDTVVSTHKTNGISRNEETRLEVLRSIRSSYGPLYLIPAVARFRVNRLRRYLWNK